MEDENFNAIKQLAVSIARLSEEAYLVYNPIVEDIISRNSTNASEIKIH